MCKKEVNHHPHKHAERFQETYIHTEQAHTGGNKWSRKKWKKKAAKAQERKSEGEREKERNGMGC